MSCRFLLVDLESVQPGPDHLERWLAETGSAWIFYGPHQSKTLPRYSALGERVTLVPISRPGKNSLDFHLVFYLGYLTARNPDSKFELLSKDSGYDPAIAHAVTLDFNLLRIETLDPSSDAAPQPVQSIMKSARKKELTTKPLAAPRKKATAPKNPAPMKTTPIVASKGAAKKKTASPKVTSKPPATSKERATIEMNGASAKKVPAKKKAVAKKKLVAKKKAVAATQVVRRSVSVKAGKTDSRTVGAIYGAVRRALNKHVSNRPQSCVALERYVQTWFGIEPVPDKVRAVVDRLLTVDVVRQEGGRLVYFQADPINESRFERAMF